MRVERIGIAEVAEIRSEWAALCARSSEPNVFADPAFVLPALAAFSPRVRIYGARSQADLIGLIVVESPRFGLGPVRAWRCDQAGLPACVFDRDHVAAALAAILSALKEEGIAGIRLLDVRRGGLEETVLRMLAVSAEIPLHERGHRARALLKAKGEGAGFEAAVDKKRRKEWARLRRRLEERGPLRLDPDCSAVAVEDFLMLEKAGWKGGQGTALSQDIRRARFFNEMTANFAGEGRLIVSRLKCADRTIAAGIALRQGGGVYYWKTAYDEAFAEFSPGLQLTLELSREWERDRAIDFVDSCAISDHPMIDRLWSEKLPLVDIVVGAAPERASALRRSLAAEDLYGRIRSQAKAILNPLRGRRRS